MWSMLSGELLARVACPKDKKSQAPLLVGRKVRTNVLCSAVRLLSATKVYSFVCKASEASTSMDT